MQKKKLLQIINSFDTSDQNKKQLIDAVNNKKSSPKDIVYLIIKILEIGKELLDMFDIHKF